MSAARTRRAGRSTHRTWGLRGTSRGRRTRSHVDSHARVELIGLDVSPPRTPKRARWTVPVLVAFLIGTLFLVMLRTEVLRLRYALAAAVEQEQDLLERKRSLTATMRRLRDPARLARRARQLGFDRPERLIRLETRSAGPDEPRSAATPDSH